MKTRLTYILTLVCIAFGLTGCVDELLNPDNEFGDGESVITAEAVFTDFTDTSLGKTRTTGDTLGNITKLDVFIFKPNGEIVEHYPISKWTTTENHGRPDGKETTEDPTVRARFTLPAPLHYGRYKMYAVANVENEKLTGIQTIDDLLNVQLLWDTSHIDKNNQMLGFFNVSDSSEGSNYDSFSAPSIAIKAPNTTLFAWVRRAASKVTVAFNGKDLLENVFVFVKSVTVHNVNKTAYLGNESKASSASDVYEDGETEYYYDRKHYPNGIPQSAFGPDYESLIAKGSHFTGSTHTDNANALFFYENMQGKGESKFQDADGNGVIDSPNSNDKDDPDWRDRKPYGTYIEVDAHYISNIPGHMGNGPIKYRFMLGQDTDKDYNVMRNCHYKVTLHFNKYANDVDWHIDYDKPEPSIEASDSFVSYLYDKEMEMPVQINGELHPNSTVYAEILTNEWFPHEAPNWMYYTEEAKNNTPWNGFLSLRDTEGRVTVGGAGWDYDINKPFYVEQKRGWREYKTQPSDKPYNEDNAGAYRVIKNEDGRMGVTILMPLYTRAKNLYKDTGFTGNNPYPAYRRKATVRIKAIIYDALEKKYKPFYKTITVYQVRRIVNPKGIWRDWDETERFYVQLTHLLEAAGTDIPNSTNSFVPFTSLGPWSAEVVGTNTSWVKLSPGVDSYEQDGKIYGYSGSSVEFYYQPTTPLASENSTPRCAMIKIRYHNFSCEHTIFVRQGYAPLAVTSGQNKWYTFNMRNQTERTLTPVEEGSMFKWRGWDTPINCTNNKRGGNYGFNISLGTSPLWIYPDNNTTGGTVWNNIGGTNGGTWSNAKIDGVSAQIASIDDYLALRDDPSINYGYGVLYDGSSDHVQMPVKDAYGYYYDDPTTEDKNKKVNGKGMRGVFVYNITTGDQIFFPIGASGFGRRKGRATDGESESLGVLRYANRSKLYNSPDQIKARPLFYRLYLSPGAIYWVNTQGTADGHNAWAWDMNYDSFNFTEFSSNAYAGGDVSTQSDACYIRCIVPNSASSTSVKKKTTQRKKPAKLHRKFRK